MALLKNQNFAGRSGPPQQLPENGILLTVTQLSELRYIDVFDKTVTDGADFLDF